MQIYLKHPRHGIKVASIEDEAKWDEKHGWIRYTPSDVNDTEEGLTKNTLSVYTAGTRSAAPLEVKSKPKGLK